MKLKLHGLLFLFLLAFMMMLTGQQNSVFAIAAAQNQMMATAVDTDYIATAGAEMAASLVATGQAISGKAIQAAMANEVNNYGTLPASFTFTVNSKIVNSLIVTVVQLHPLATMAPVTTSLTIPTTVTTGSLSNNSLNRFGTTQNSIVTGTSNPATSAQVNNHPYMLAVIGFSSVDSVSIPENIVLSSYNFVVQLNPATPWNQVTTSLTIPFVAGTDFAEFLTRSSLNSNLTTAYRLVNPSLKVPLTVAS